MRSKRGHVLYHGTLMYDFNLERISQLLAKPTRVPAYRAGRGHAEFVTNLPLMRKELIDALVEGWQATSELPSWPEQRTTELVNTKYAADPQWKIYLPDESPSEG